MCMGKDEEEEEKEGGDYKKVNVKKEEKDD